LTYIYGIGPSVAKNGLYNELWTHLNNLWIFYKIDKQSKLLYVFFLYH
jgi:hypothetical protein